MKIEKIKIDKSIEESKIKRDDFICIIESLGDKLYEIAQEGEEYDIFIYSKNNILLIDRLN